MKTPNHIMGHHFKQMCLLIVVLALDICLGKSLQSQSDQTNNETNETIIEHLIDNPTNIQVWLLGRPLLFTFYRVKGKQACIEQTHSKRLRFGCSWDLRT